MSRYEEFKDIIQKQKNKVNLKLRSIDFGKGYCIGMLNTSTANDISQDEYDELAKFIDDIFDK